MQPYLYHSSTHKNLKVLMPTSNPHAPKQGKHVFATTNKQYAAVYLLPSSCGPMYIDTERSPIALFINNKLQNVTKHDIGGSIYTVSSNGFIKTPQTGLEETELVNPNEVAVLEEEDYDSALSALKELGVEVFIINNESFNTVPKKPANLKYSNLVKYSTRIA